MSNDFSEIEINILQKNKFIHTEIITLTSKKEFEIEEKKYDVKPECVYLIPCKNGFMPTSFYIEGNKEPLDLKDKNKGIPSRALHLLWNPILYQELVTPEEDKTNLIIIIMLLAGFVLHGIKLYLTYGGG